MSRQKYVCRDIYNFILFEEINFLRDKHNFCQGKHTFVATKDVLLNTRVCFVATKLILAAAPANDILHRVHVL